jgi:hypothetical protein
MELRRDGAHSAVHCTDGEINFRKETNDSLEEIEKEAD